MNNSNMSYNDNTGKQINNTRRANNVIAQQCNNLINNNNNNSNNNNNNNYSQNDRWHSACCKSKGSSKRAKEGGHATIECHEYIVSRSVIGQNLGGNGVNS